METYHGRMTPDPKIRNKNNNLIIWVFSGIIMLTVYFIGYSYYTNLNQSKKAVLNKLSAIVNTATSVIDGNLHHDLSSKYLTKDAITNNAQDSVYQTLHKLLKQIHLANNLQSPLYTMVYDQQKSTFEFIASSSKHPYYRHTYKQFPMALLEQHDTGGVLDTYESENGQWLSAFAPIKNLEGNVVALIQADQSFGEFINQARIELFQNITLALFMILPFTFLLFAYVKTTLNKEEKNHTILLEKNNQIEVQNAFIQEKNDKLKATKLLIEQKNVALNAEVHKRTKKLIESNEELSTFLYRSSHDIQGPLATLRGLCQLASKDIEDPQASAYVHMINDTTNKIYHTIKSINNVYEIKNKEIKAENVKLKPLINKISEAFEDDIKDKGITLSIDIHDNLSILADREIALLVLTELIKNSIQFSSRLNGKLPYIRIIAQQINEQIQIEIEDNGIGIHADTDHLIFEMFQKGTEHSKGAGLGLYVAKIGVEKLKGSIHLNTDNPHFTSFRIVMPTA